MGLCYSTIDEALSYPRPGRLLLTCDGEHGLFEGPNQAFYSKHGFIGMYRDAMAAGWKDTFRGGNRVFLGPCCSGKPVGCK